MNRRTFLTDLFAASAATSLTAWLTSCGDGQDDTVTSFRLPTGADDIVVRLGFGGGFMPIEAYFLAMPSLVITGDRRVIEPAPIAEIYPGPLVAPLTVRTITAGGLQRVIAAAAEAGLLAEPPGYELPDGIEIYDASSTYLDLAADGAEFSHVAYALGLEGTSTPDRKRLSAYIRRLGDLTALAGTSALGDEQPFVPDSYRVRAEVAEPDTTSEPAATIVPWPDGVLDLRDAAGCARVEAAAVGDLFAEATELIYFEQQGVTYRLLVVAELPGDAGCA